MQPEASDVILLVLDGRGWTNYADSCFADPCTLVTVNVDVNADACVCCRDRRDTIRPGLAGGDTSSNEAPAEARRNKRTAVAGAQTAG